MPVTAISKSSLQKKIKIAVLSLTICVFLVSVIYISYSLLWTFAKKNAEEFAINLLDSIPPPSSTVQIQNWSGSSGTSLECYAGFSSTLYGSDLALTEVVKYYRNDFKQRGWFVMPREIDTIIGEDGRILGTDEEDISIMGTGIGEIDYYINVIICRSSYCSSFPHSQVDDSFVNLARKQHETVYWLSIRYIPDHVRNNLCGCCSGG